MTFRRVGSVVAVLGVAACRGTIPQQVLSGTAPATPVVTAPAALEGPFVVRRTTERRSFTLETRGVLTVTRDTVTSTDSLGAQLDVAYTAFAGTPRLTGSVTAYRVRAADGMFVAPASVTLPITFAAAYGPRGGALAFATPAATGCAAPAAIVQGVRDLWTRAPDTLRVGSVWQDSALVVSCRDGITLRASTVRVFRVVGAAMRGDAVELDIRRESRATITGDGHPAGEAVTVTGSASGVLALRYRPELDAFTSGEGMQTLELSLASSVVAQRVRQRTQLRLTATSVHEP